ncbi:phosphomethylpyrimidine kinase [Pararhizobium polonicum]|uniref:hydroxymethylpyrimidine kinase n=1 Tax=Pararhizobium polonicum TaxID=1612624 RepID=A0A1C7P5M1_9HYPH|nr:hydroxymethylpyrimidine/phosphomethylpyrimidine kinase [Pararhizobium polonicum]OBZ96583.1 phosphomethylpyrimidine kinase [Pararhizobium polonicum]
MTRSTPHMLVVAGSDSSGGAGIVRDIETLAAFGIKASVAITAVTAQTHRDVLHVETIPPDRVVQQMHAALTANPVTAIKIGMLATTATIEAVAKVLANHPDIPVVLDPVLVSTSGGMLLTPGSMAALRDLFGSCTLITPNLPELSRLTAVETAGARENAAGQARRLIAAGVRAVLVKGGHDDGMESVDILIQPDRADQSFAAPRLEASMRGTGCMLASAIAARLAFGDSLATAIATAKAFVHRKLSEG